MQFEISNYTVVSLSNMNTRVEKHGVESVTAVDLNFVMDAANSILDMFDKKLLEALYEKRDSVDDDPQDEIDGIEEISNLPNLKFPSLAPIAWEKKGSGYKLSIDYGLGGDRCINIEDCKVGKYKLSPKEGGTVEVKFQVQLESGLTEAIIGKIAMMIGQEVSIELRAPESVGEPAGEDKPLFPDYKPDAPLTATDVFIAGATTH
jgi:hypothetical protein